MQIGAAPHVRAQSENTEMRRPIEAALATEGVHREIPLSDDCMREPAGMDDVDTLQETPSGTHHPSTIEWTDKQHEHRDKRTKSEDGSDQAPGSPSVSTPTGFHRSQGKGHAHNPLEDMLFLDVGAGESPEDYVPGELHLVSESPGATDFDVYEKAYQEEVDRLIGQREQRPTLYLTRRVESIKKLRESEFITDHTYDAKKFAKSGLANLVHGVRANVQKHKIEKEGKDESPE